MFSSNSPNQNMHPEDTRNLIVFILISIVIFFIFDKYFMEPRIEKMREAQKTEQAGAQNQNEPGNAIPGENVGTQTTIPREAALTESPRIKIENEKISGSINLKGGIIDDLELKNYFKTLESEDRVILFSPKNTKHPYYTDYGWIAGADQDIKLPGSRTIWSVKGRNGNNDVTLTPDNPVQLFWDNGQGIRFHKTISVDENYLFRIAKSIENNTDKTLTLYPYSLVSRRGLPENPQGQWILHEGPIAYINGELFQSSYKSLMKGKNEVEIKAERGWIGITDKYWMASILPHQGEEKTYRIIHKSSGDRRNANTSDLFQIDVLGEALVVGPGSTGTRQERLFAGAKQLSLLDAYEKQLDIDHFDLAIDFGWFYFLTKPFFYVLTFFSDLTGNFGIAIIILTIFLRIAVFPLANTSYKSFARLKQISPQIMELREKYGEDRQKLQQELVKLYEKEKVNPMAGCFPILIQIPIFFALYKVLFVTLEMRHAPFFGWIQDLSAQDPTSLFNAFGLLPYDVPGFLQIGAWPCIMMVAMLIQQKLNPPPQDPLQRQIMMFFPFMITIIMAQFPAGLVIYWSFSAILSIIQQYIIMRMMGVEVHLFKKSKNDEKMDKMISEGPSVHPGAEMIEEEFEEAITGNHNNETDTNNEPKESKPVSKPKPKKKKKK